MKKTFLIAIAASLVVFGITLPLARAWGETAGYEKGWEVGQEKGFKSGFEEGLKEGSKYSILRFVEKVYLRHLYEMDKALSMTKEVRNEETLRNLRISAQATVVDVKRWRQVEDKFKEFLDSEIDALESAIQRNDYDKMEELIPILLQTYDGKRLALERELEKIKP